MQIIKTKLNDFVTATIAAYKASGTSVHIAIVSALWHVAKHGDASVLNKVYRALRSNDQTAVKLYIRRAFIVNGLNGGDPSGLPTSTINEAAAIGAILAFEKGEFVVSQGPGSAGAKSLMKLCAERFINPDGKQDYPVLFKNNFTEVKTLGDTDMLKKLIKLAAELTPTDTRRVTVSDKTAALITSAAQAAEIQLELLS